MPGLLGLGCASIQVVGAYMCARIRLQQRKRLMVLGRANVITLEQGKQLAIEVLNKVTVGEDPERVPRQRRAVKTEGRSAAGPPYEPANCSLRRESGVNIQENWPTGCLLKQENTLETGT